MLHKYCAVHNMYLIDPCIFYSWHNQFYDTKRQSDPTAFSSHLSEWNFLCSRCSFKSTVQKAFSRQNVFKVTLEVYKTQSVHFFVVTQNKHNFLSTKVSISITQGMKVSGLSVMFFSHAVTSAHWSGREKEPSPFLILYLSFLLVYMALYLSFLYFHFTYRLPLIFWPLVASVWCNTVHEL